MWELTITHGEYHDLKTLVHRSKNEHDWTRDGDAWQFTGYDDDGRTDWSALVANVRSAVDVKQVDQPATASGEGEDPVSGWVQDGTNGMNLTAPGEKDGS